VRDNRDIKSRRSWGCESYEIPALEEKSKRHPGNPFQKKASKKQTGTWKPLNPEKKTADRETGPERGSYRVPVERKSRKFPICVNGSLRGKRRRNNAEKKTNHRNS